MSNNKWWALAFRVAGIGWYVAVCIVVGILGGVWLDGKLGTTPLFILLGTIIGTIAAFYGMYRMVVPLLGDQRPEGGNKG